MNKYVNKKTVISAIAAFALAACSAKVAEVASDAAASADKTDLSSAMPSFGVSSPTSSDSSSGNEIARFLANAMGEEDEPAEDSLEKQREEIQEILAEDDISKCFEKVNFEPVYDNVQCYGPQLAYTDHPDGEGGNGCNGQNAPQANCLPGGDLGLWIATEGDTQACSAAKMNALVQQTAGVVNNGMKVMAGLLCVAQIKGRTLPEEGQTLDLTADFAGQPVTVSAASLEFAGTANNRPIYQAVMSVEIPGDNAAEFDITLRHSPDNESGDYTGRVHGTVTSNNQLYGFSVVYDQSGNDLSYAAKSGRHSANVSKDDLFDNNGNYSTADFQTNGGSDGKYMLAKLNKDSGLGAVKFAWQAGGGDGKARVFHISTEAGEDGDVGVAYFGFGPNFSSQSLGSIGGMCCNWAGPSGTCMQQDYDSENVQSQTLVRAEDGSFAADDNFLTYAPTTTCDYDGNGSFKFAVPDEWDDAQNAGAVANELVQYGSQGSMPNMSEPDFSE